MRVDRINYQKLFPIGIYQNIRVGVEAEVESGDDPNESLNKLKSFVEAWFSENYPHVGESVTISGYGSGIREDDEPVITGTEGNKKTMDRRIGLLVGDITSCEELKVLESYRLLVKKAPELQAAYEKKYKELSKKSTTLVSK